MLVISVMARGKSLTGFEKGQVLAYHRNDWPVSKISRILKRSDKVIANFLKCPEKYGTKKSPGRPRKLTKREERGILKLASNSEVSAKAIIATQGLSVSKFTVLRVIHRSGHLVRTKICCAPALTKEHKLRRLEFARVNIRTNWKKVSVLDLFCQIVF